MFFGAEMEGFVAEKCRMFRREIEDVSRRNRGEITKRDRLFLGNSFRWQKHKKENHTLSED